jgi:hypothetical protein
MAMKGKLRNVDKWLAAQRGASVTVTADDLIGYLRRTWPGISEDEIDVIHQEAGFGWRMSPRPPVRGTDNDPAGLSRVFRKDGG